MGLSRLPGCEGVYKRCGRLTDDCSYEACQATEDPARRGTDRFARTLPTHRRDPLTRIQVDASSRARVSEHLWRNTPVATVVKFIDHILVNGGLVLVTARKGDIKCCGEDVFNNSFSIRM